MSVSSLFYDLVIFSMFLLAGFALRELIPALRKIYLPTAVIGGLIALIGGKQLLGIWEVPSSFGSFSTPLIAFVVTASSLGISFNLPKLKNYGDFFCAYNGLRFAELGIGTLVGIICCTVMPNLLKGWGLLGVATFHGGHGDGSLYGAMLDTAAGTEEYTSLAMVMATVGILIAILCGSVIANIGIRKGWPQFMKAGDKSTDSNRRAFLEESEQKSIGTQIVHGGAVSALSLQFALVCMCIFVGKWIFAGVGLLIPAIGGIANYILDGIVGAFVMTPILRLLKLDKYIEPKTLDTFSSFCIEIVVLGAVANLKLSTVATYALPIIVMAIFMVGLCLFNIWYHRKISEDQWFEKGLYSFGAGTGTQATGMALLQMVDPSWHNDVMEANAVHGGIMNIAIAWWPVVLPVLALGKTWAVVGIGVGGAIVLYLIGWFVFGKKKR